MFTQPKYGWSYLQLDNFEFPVSYVKNTPQDCIESFKIALNTTIPFSIIIDGEDKGDCYIVSDNWHTLVIYEDQETQKYTIIEFNFDKNDLAKQFIKDMNTQDWTRWTWNEENTIYDISTIVSLLKE